MKHEDIAAASYFHYWLLINYYIYILLIFS